jgi:hypothetical protein
VDKTIKLTFSEDEAEMLVDALEVDLEGYLRSAKEARGNQPRRCQRRSPKRLTASAS